MCKISLNFYLMNGKNELVKFTTYDLFGTGYSNVMIHKGGLFSATNISLNTIRFYTVFANKFRRFCKRAAESGYTGRAHELLFTI